MRHGPQSLVCRVQMSDPDGQPHSYQPLQTANAVYAIDMLPSSSEAISPGPPSSPFPYVKCLFCFVIRPALP